MIKAIIFDIGGVVLTPGEFELLREHYTKLLNIPQSKFRPIFRANWRLWRINKINEDQFWDNIFTELGIQYDNRKLLKKIMRDFPSVDDEIVEILKKLKGEYKIYALTNHAKEWFEWEIKNYKLDELFDFIQTSYDSESAKPEEKIYLDLLKNSKLKPEECIFFDDQEDNIEAAKKIGFHAFQFKEVDGLKQNLIKFNIQI